MAQINYQLNTADIEAFHKHAQKSAPLNWMYGPGIALFAIAFIVSNLGTVFGDQSIIEKTARILASLTVYTIFAISTVLLIQYFMNKGMRRVIKDKKNAFKLLPHTLDIDENGLQESNEHECTRVSWKVVTKIDEDPERVFIYYGTSQAIIVPKRAFNTTSDLQHFTALTRRSYEQTPQQTSVGEAKTVDVNNGRHPHADRTQLNHSGYGISSFVLSLVSGLLWIGMIIVIILVPVATLREDPHKAVSALYTLITVCVALLAVFLGFIGVFQKQKKKALAFSGMIIGIMPLLMIAFFILLGAVSRLR